ncbi:MAG TPA: TonB family protein [Thermoanaerobaculia bacterium]|nr:TonB family protein [Thermoanaerobaculia bacterium]
MASRSKRYARFERHLLLKKIEQSPLSELWRAVRIGDEALGQTVALRRFVSHRDEFAAAITTASTAIPVMTGTTVARGQSASVSDDGVPFLVWEYSGGRSLRSIMERSRGGAGTGPHPIPLDQALGIAERLAFSLETTGTLKFEGRRLLHGGLIPEFVWITDEGEIHTTGQQLGPAVVASLADPAVSSEIGGYVAPEIRESRQATPRSETFSLGAILYALLTGSAPPDPTGGETTRQRLQTATLTIGEPLPEEIRSVLDKALHPDPGQRYETPGSLRQALAKLIQSGSYAPTTFNLAFYVHNLLRDEMAEEARERDAESKIDPRPYLFRDTAQGEEAASHVPRSFELAAGEADTPKRSRVPLIAAALILVVGGAGAGWFVIKRTRRAEPAQIASSVPAQPKRPLAVATQPLIASTDTGGLPVDIDAAGATTAGTGAETPEEARRRAIEEEIQRRLQEEMLKLQAAHDRKLRAERQAEQQPKPVPSTVAAAPPQEEIAPPRTQQPTAVPVSSQPEPHGDPAVVETEAAAPQTTPAQKTPPLVPAAAPAPVITEGDLIEIAEVDQAPRLVRSKTPVYPPLAKRQKAEATIIVSALVSESGKVLDVKILRGDNRRLGLDEAAMAAVRGSVYEPAVKSGKKVKTWLPVPVIFRAQ